MITGEIKTEYEVLKKDDVTILENSLSQSYSMVDSSVRTTLSDELNKKITDASCTIKSDQIKVTKIVGGSSNGLYAAARKRLLQTSVSSHVTLSYQVSNTKNACDATIKDAITKFGANDVSTLQSLISNNYLLKAYSIKITKITPTTPVLSSTSSKSSSSSSSDKMESWVIVVIAVSCSLVLILGIVVALTYSKQHVVYEYVGSKSRSRYR
jgi:hypothetical protein